MKQWQFYFLLATIYVADATESNVMNIIVASLFLAAATIHLVRDIIAGDDNENN